jgi:GalNAc5-diNAcBac-PP-undecaprenol beta-1,3-glucosyltransferase
MISIIMATYDRGQLLPRAVDSVLRQSLPDWELIIVDDGSTDATREYLAHLHDSRIKVFRHVTNRGVAAAKNTGLDHIGGEWFTFLDSDDEAIPEALSVMYDAATRTGATVITCNCREAISGRLAGTGPAHDRRLSPRDGMRLSGEHWGMVSTSLVDGLRFDERLPGWEGLLWLKVNVRARRYFIARPLRIYHTEGEDRVSVAANEADLAEKVEVFCRVGEDRDYLKALRRMSARGYVRMMMRIWAARVLRPFVSRIALR